MWTFIEQLRQKTEIEKQSLALIASAVITGIIFIGWLVTLPFTVSSIAQEAQEIQTATPLQTIGAQVDVIRDTVGTIQNLEEPSSN